MYCKHCGREIESNSQFCQYCGYRLSQQKDKKKFVSVFKNIIKAVKSNRKLKIVLSVIAAILVASVLYHVLPLLFYLLVLIGVNVGSWFASYRWTRKKWFFWVSLVATGTMIFTIVPLLFGLVLDIRVNFFCALLLASIAFITTLCVKNSVNESGTAATPHFEKIIIDVHICNHCGEVHLKDRPHLCSKCSHSVMRTVKVETVNDGKFAISTCLDCQQKSFDETYRCQSCGSDNIITEYRDF